MAGIKDHGIGSQAVGVQILLHRASFSHLPQGAVRALTTPSWEQWQRGRTQILVISITDAEMEAQRGGVTSPKPHSKKEAEPEFDLRSWWRGTLCHSKPTPSQLTTASLSLVSLLLLQESKVFKAMDALVGSVWRKHSF